MWRHAQTRGGHAHAFHGPAQIAALARQRPWLCRTTQQPSKLARSKAQAAGAVAGGCSPKSAGAAAHVVLHDLRLHHLPKLGEVVLELVCGAGRRVEGGEHGSAAWAAWQKDAARAGSRPPCRQQTGGMHGTQHQLPRPLPACPAALRCNAMAERAACRPCALRLPGPLPMPAVPSVVSGLSPPTNTLRALGFSSCGTDFLASI